MRVLLIHIDGEMPNLVLMKWSAFHKRKGNNVFLEKHALFSQPIVPDEVYISCVFSWNAGDALGIAKMFDCPVYIGGPGIDLTTELPDEVEHIMPDYDIYGIDYSIGFFSRGCIRKCPWCIVPEKEGWIRKHAPISEFWNPKHKKLILLDNNLLACSEWKEALEFIISHKLMVNFSQGLDIRLIDHDNANWLSKIHAFTRTFNTPMFHFAFDDVNYEDAVRKGVHILQEHGVKPYRQTFYILCAFNMKAKDYTWDYFLSHDYYRFQVLRELDINPYVMKYNDRQDIPLLNAFDRWVNSRPPIYKVSDFKDYKYTPPFCAVK